MGSAITVADMGIMPFIRQFAHMDRDLFYSLPYPNLQVWLGCWSDHPLFLQAMLKYSPWREEVGVELFSAPT